jgi:hypothetical protein
MRRRGYITHARRHWPRAIWVRGQGPIALLAWCNKLSVTLHAEHEVAEAVKAMIDRHGCGHRCYRKHVIVDLDAEVAA